MRARVLISGTLLLRFALGAYPETEKPNFSGTWVLDKDRSFSNPPGLNQTLAVVHKDDEVKLDAKLVIQQKETVINETWILDGKEREFTPPGASQGPAGKRKAYWLPANRGIVIEDETTASTPGGPTAQRTMRKYTLSSDGRTLTVDYYIDSPRGSFESKRVFLKKTTSENR
jgi:hypothetical protein